MELHNPNPANVDQLAKDPEWRRRMQTLVRGFPTIRRRNDVEDVCQDLLAIMKARVDPECAGVHVPGRCPGCSKEVEGVDPNCESKKHQLVSCHLCLDYVQRWDPAKGGGFKNWIYTFCRNECIKRWKRSVSRGGRLLENAVAIVVGLDTEEGGAAGWGAKEVQEDRIAGTISGTNQETSTLLASCTRVAKSLSARQPAHSWVECHEDHYVVRSVDDAPGSSGVRHAYSEKYPKIEGLVGHTVRRDVGTVFLGLACDMEPQDIAGVMKTSRQFVYTLHERVRRDREVIEFGRALGRKEAQPDCVLG